MRRAFPYILLAGCLAVFVYGLAVLFNLRFQGGDVYPPYSSLRADPLGASALYESLGRLPDHETTRDFRRSDELPEGADTAYIQLASRLGSWDDISAETFQSVETFLHRGGRLVITFFPENQSWESPYSEPEAEKDKKDSPKDKKTKSSTAKKSKRHLLDPDDDPIPSSIPLKRRWGFDTAFQRLGTGRNSSYEPMEVENQNISDLPSSISWHSATIFTNLDRAWRVIYSRGTNAVLIERQFGPGSVVLATDSFFASNEALQKERHADLLAWLVGPARHVTFDEAHFGIVYKSSIATLIRQYHLHALVLSLLLVAALFVWKNSASLAPRYAELDAAGYVTGKDSASGFVSLLRRHIAPRDLLNVCVAQWKKSSGREKRASARMARVEQIVAAENALPVRQQNPLRAYRAISETLK